MKQGMRGVSPGSHVGGTRVAKRGKSTLGSIMYRREQSWHMRHPDLDFATLLYMPFTFL